MTNGIDLRPCPQMALYLILIMPMRSTKGSAKNVFFTCLFFLFYAYRNGALKPPRTNKSGPHSFLMICCQHRKEMFLLPTTPEKQRRKTRYRNLNLGLCSITPVQCQVQALELFFSTLAWLLGLENYPLSFFSLFQKFRHLIIGLQNLSFLFGQTVGSTLLRQNMI